MFGRRRAKNGKTRRQWKDAPGPGTVEIRPDASPDPRSAATVLRRVLSEVGGGDVPGFDVTVSTREQPLSFVVDGVWRRPLAADAVTGLLDRLNHWNAGHTVPRAHSGLDAAGRLRVRADSELACGAGVTLQQLDEWMRRALAGISALGEYLDEAFPGEIPDGDGGDGREDCGDGDTADGDITALITPGNRYGLCGGPTPPLLLPRLGQGSDAPQVDVREVKEDGASGRRGNGYLRFPAGPDVALHDGTVTVSEAVPLGAVDDGTVVWLRTLCDRMNAVPGGVVAVVAVTPDSAGTALLTCAVHRPVGSGMADDQIADAVTRDRGLVATATRVLLAEITGDADA